MATPRTPRWTNHVDPPAPVRDRRMTGTHWWDPDRIRHMDDAPRHCPACGGTLENDGSISVEYWEADRRIFHTSCHACGWTGDISTVNRMVGHEAAE